MNIGIAGGGQLGRMLTEATHKLGHKVVVLDSTPNSPAGQVADEQIVGDYKDEHMMLQLAEKSDVMTYEVESVNAAALEQISATGKSVHPVPTTLSTIKDKLAQKQFLREHGIAVGDFMAINLGEKTVGDTYGLRVAEIGKSLGYPFVLKARSGGFDGRGNALVRSESEIDDALQRLGTNVYAEKFIKFEKELAVVAARTTNGQVEVYPLVETIHKDHICHITLAPAPVPSEISQKARELAEKVLKAFAGAGVFGIEMFLANGEVLINEIAPRVHNSGHWTIEGAKTSQFEQHIRAITGMPLGSVEMAAPAAVMVNILGERNGAAEPKGVNEAEKIQGVKVHIYGKIETRMQRKMGHLTAIAESIGIARENAEKARSIISI